MNGENGLPTWPEMERSPEVSDLLTCCYGLEDGCHRNPLPSDVLESISWLKKKADRIGICSGKITVNLGNFLKEYSLVSGLIEIWKAKQTGQRPQLPQRKEVRRLQIETAAGWCRTGTSVHVRGKLQDGYHFVILMNAANWYEHLKLAFLDGHKVSRGNSKFPGLCWVVQAKRVVSIRSHAKQQLEQQFISFEDRRGFCDYENNHKHRSEISGFHKERMVSS